MPTGVHLFGKRLDEHRLPEWMQTEEMRQAMSTLGFRLARNLDDLRRLYQPRNRLPIPEGLTANQAASPAADPRRAYNRSGRSPMTPEQTDIDPVTRSALTSFKAILSARYGAHLKTLYLFGSRARGDHRLDSHADVAVFLDPVADPSQFTTPRPDLTGTPVRDSTLSAH